MPRHAESLHGPSRTDAPMESDYTSRILPLFVEYLESHPQGKLLDVGPVCGENIRFFASRAEKLYVCDLFRRLLQEMGKGRSASHIWRDLNYPVGSFDAIELWNFGDHLEDRDLARLVELCILMLKPKGLLMLIAVGEKAPTTFPSTFAIRDGFRFHVQARPELHLPRYHRHNRDLIAMLSPFKLVKSFIYRSGLREFLFQHP